jgi:hypothetical protein
MADETAPADTKTFTQADVDAMIATATTGLRSKVDELLGETKTAKAEREKAKAAAEEAARKSGDVQAIEASWQGKFTARETELTGALSQREAMIQQLTAGAAAKDIANELAIPGSARLIEAEVLKRLGVEVRDGEVRITVKDQAGKPSALTVAELKAELAKDPALQPILVGTKGSGGGAAGQSGGATGKTITRAAFDALGHAARSAFFSSGGTVKD